MTAAYASNPLATNLVSFPPRDTGWSSASWRDSGAGYAGGRFAMDVNTIWAPHALESIEQILSIVRRLGLSVDSVARAKPNVVTGQLGLYARDSLTLRHAIDTWWGASRHFLVRLDPADVRARVNARLAAMPAGEREYWTDVVARTGADRDSLSFLAVALDATGRPIGVANTDPATRIFLGDRGDPAATEAMLRDVRTFVRPYPAGLRRQRFGRRSSATIITGRESCGDARSISFSLASPTGSQLRAVHRSSDMCRRCVRRSIACGPRLTRRGSRVSSGAMRSGMDVSFPFGMASARMCSCGARLIWRYSSRCRGCGECVSLYVPDPCTWS
jgi:hypothetical protein